MMQFTGHASRIGGRGGDNSQVSLWDAARGLDQIKEQGAAPLAWKQLSQCVISGLAAVLSEMPAQAPAHALS